MSRVIITWERLGRGARTEGDTDTLAIPDDLKGDAFLDRIAEEVFKVARPKLSSSWFAVTAWFDDDSTTTGRVSIEAGRFGRARFESLPPSDRVLETA
jgi:hypothetical protein